MVIHALSVTFVISYIVFAGIFVLMTMFSISKSNTMRKEKGKEIIEALSSYDHNDNIVYYEYNTVYYKNQVMRLGKTVYSITDNYLIYSDSNSKKIIDVENVGKRTFEVKYGYSFIYDDTFLYYMYNDKYYQYNMNDSLINESFKEEYYIHRDGSDLIFNVNDSKDAISIAGSLSKTITINNISSYFSDIPHLDSFSIYSYQRNENNLFIGICYQDCCFIVIQYDIENDSYLLFDWFKVDNHGDYFFIDFYVFKSDFQTPLNKYFIT